MTQIGVLCLLPWFQNLRSNWNASWLIFPFPKWVPGSKIFVQKYSFKLLPTININCSSFVTAALLPSELYDKFEKNALLNNTLWKVQQTAFMLHLAWGLRTLWGLENICLRVDKYLCECWKIFVWGLKIFVWVLKNICLGVKIY